VRFAFDLRKWIASQLPQIPTPERVTQHMDDLRSGSLRPSTELPSPGLLLSFSTHLKAELQERPEWIVEIADEIAERKPAQKVLRLANRVFQRSSKKPAHQLAAPSQRAKGGRPKGAKDPDTDPRIWLAAALSVLGYSEYSMAPRLYPKATKTSAEKNTDTFLRRNREEFEKRKGALNKQQAEDIVKKRMS
jgi:hypothetical protein